MDELLYALRLLGYEVDKKYIDAEKATGVLVQRAMTADELKHARAHGKPKANKVYVAFLVEPEKLTPAGINEYVVAAHYSLTHYDPAAEESVAA